MKKSKEFSNKSIVLKDAINGISTLTYVALLFSALTFILVDLAPELDSENKLSFGLVHIINTSNQAAFSANVWPFIYIIAAFLIGLIQFSFLHQKENCYTTLSFPLKRRSIYLNRALIPLIALIIITLIVNTVSLKLNLTAFNNNPTVYKVWLYYMLGIFRLLLVSYCAGVISSMFCGKTIEAGLLGASSLFAVPSISLYIGFIASLFGYGSTFSAYELYYSVSDFAPISFNIISDTYYLNEFAAPDMEQYIIASLIWVTVSIVVLVLGCFYFEKAYKPEISGIKGAKPVSRFIICFTAPTFVAYIISSLILSRYYENTVNKTAIIAIAASLVTAFIAAFICNFIIHLSFANMKTPLISSGVIAAITVICAVVCASGFMDSYGKIPDKKDVKSVDISIPLEQMYSLSDAGFTTFINSFHTNSGQQFTFTESEDIDLCLKVHETILEHRDQDTGLAVNITYTLKNGKTVDRYYRYISYETVKDILLLDETDEVKNLLKNNLLPEEAETDEEGEKANIQYDMCKTNIISEYYVTRDVTEELTEEQFYNLRSAIWKDLSKKNAEKRLNPSGDYLGTVSFSFYLDNPVKISQYYVTNFVETTVMIYSDMAETVKILNEASLTHYLDVKRPVSCAYIIDSQAFQKQFMEIYVDDYLLEAPKNPCFALGRLDYEYTDFYKQNSEKISDPKEIEKLIDSGCAQHLITEDNPIKILVVEYDSDTDPVIVYGLK